MDPDALTPVERWEAIWLKRDDTFHIGQSRGGKVRTCLHIAAEGKANGGTTLVTAGSRHSPQVNIVAAVANHLGMQAECHVPEGPSTPELQAAEAAGATIVRHRPGHNSVIVARARTAAERPGCVHIPFGMETPLAAEYTAKQAGNLPHGEYRRIVVPVGSGMSLAGVIAGTPDETTIVGVSVGADPTKRLDRYAPMWRFRDVRMVQSEIPYGKPAPVSRLGDIKLDPIYEAKCLPFLQADDLFWIVGIRQTEQDEIHETKENKHA